MFKCSTCQKSSQRPTKIVTERRMHDHLNGATHREGPRGGYGQQIVKEITICDGCRSTVQEAPVELAAPNTSSEIAANNLSYDEDVA